MEAFAFLTRPWPWYVAGPLIGLTVPALLLLGSKCFGIRGNLRTVCSWVPSNIAFFRVDWRRDAWNLAFAVGILVGGTVVGVLLANPEPLRSEIVSWYRIQEMFRFQGFPMYGIIGSAVLVAAVSLWILRRVDAKTFAGQAIVVPRKARTWRRYILGGSVFGLGWALVGACPGPGRRCRSRTTGTRPAPW